MYQPYLYKVISETQHPDHSVVVANASLLPEILDEVKFNLALTTYALSSEAQPYFDKLNLRDVLQNAPDRLPQMQGVEDIFSVHIGNLNRFSEIAERNLPKAPGREDLIEAMIEVSAIMGGRLGQDTSFHVRVVYEGGGILHKDALPHWRALWQPNQIEDPTPTTIFGENSLTPISGNNYGDVSTINPVLLWSSPSNSLMLWTGAESSIPRPHAPPILKIGDKARLTLVAHQQSSVFRMH
jgi:hypothetical protein